MRSPGTWHPSFVQQLPDGRFAANLGAVYGGSQHITTLQVNALVPLIRQHARGEVLDAACGQLPYMEVYRPLTTGITCTDLDNQHPHADVACDLNHRWPFAEQTFDTILLLDVIAHLEHPAHALKEAARCLRPGGKLILSTPFAYWISMFPDEYYHPTGRALRLMSGQSGMHILHLEPYGGYPDVLLDTLNKGAASGWRNRLFRMFKSQVIKTRWYRRSNEKTRYSYPLGYTLVAQKV